MPRRQMDRFLNDALKSFSGWLKENEWRGKERDCVNLFAHKFLFGKIEPGAAIAFPTQVSIECSVKQPKQFSNPAAVKDLVIWKRPMQTAWSSSWEPVHSPKVVMEWKVFFKKRPPRAIFNRHDEDWIVSYTKEHTSAFGYLVSVDLASEEPMVYWKKARAGVFAKVKEW